MVWCSVRFLPPTTFVDKDYLPAVCYAFLEKMPFRPTRYSPGS
jgi:hypothetical protein